MISQQWDNNSRSYYQILRLFGAPECANIRVLMCLASEAGWPMGGQDGRQCGPANGSRYSFLFTGFLNTTLSTAIKGKLEILFVFQ